MLSIHSSKLLKKRIILASSSPRRKEILELMGLNFESIPSTFAEDLNKSLFSHPSLYVLENSKIKAMEVYEKEKERGVDLVIGCDTVVVKDGKILEKPIDDTHAFEMLKSLSDSIHHVYSGVSLIYTDNFHSSSSTKTSSFKVISFFEETEVHFAALSNETINNYIKTREPFDKAGGYGIQGIGGDFVTGIKGCYFNVMGFPRHAVAKKIKQILD